MLDEDILLALAITGHDGSPRNAYVLTFRYGQGGVLRSLVMMTGNVVLKMCHRLRAIDCEHGQVDFPVYGGFFLL